MTSTELAKELALLYQRISEPLTRSPEGLMDELDERSQWLARSSELLAEAQYILDRKRGEEAERLTGFPPSVGREVLAGRSAEEARLHRLADRLNVTITHQLDAIRSVLSFEKSLATQSRTAERI